MIVRDLVERVYFTACLAVGRLLRSARYSQARLVREGGEQVVKKRRLFYAPLLVWLGGALHAILDTSVRVLPQREWEDRERELYARLHGASMRIDTDGTLVLPVLAGTTLAALLEDPALEESKRRKAIEMAVIALAGFHARGFTHGDAMAENVMVDLEAGVARWFDFETMHGPGRSSGWRRADDVRALLMTCLARASRERVGEILRIVLDVYADEDVARVLATSFDSAIRRPLAFHLGQAGLSLDGWRGMARLLRQRRSPSGTRDVPLVGGTR